MSKLSLPKKSRIKGLYLYCPNCGENFSSDSTIRKTKKCPTKSSHKLLYKARIHIPGTKNAVKSKVLIATNLNDAIIECNAFEKFLTESNFQPQIIETKKATPRLLIDCMADYMGYLNNEGVPYHLQKIRTKAHINEVDRFFRYFNEALKKEKVNLATLQFSQLDDEPVGFFHNYLENIKSYNAKTYNKAMGCMRIFTDYINDKYGLKKNNPFKDVQAKVVIYNIETIDKEDFFNLLDIIKPDNGIEILSTGERKNHYKPWLKDAFRLGLYTGRRREEIVRFKFSDIIEDKKGRMTYLESENLKVTRAKQIDTNQKIKFRIGINKELRELLMELGYDKYKGTDNYILAPNETMNRITMMNLMSKAFSHYYGQLNTGKDLQFKHLRKTYISKLYKHYGEQARVLTSHSNIEVLKKHYIDGRLIQDVNDNFSVF